MWLLLIPIFCVVMAFVVVSAFAGAIWLVGTAWPWLLIGFGAWMLWHEDKRGARRQERGARVHRSRPSMVPDVGATRPHDAIPRSPIPDPRSQRELPIDLQVKVEQIRRKVDVLLSYADRFPPFSQDLYLVRQTATEYLPRTINAFLGLPKDSVDKPLSGAQKTGRQELKAQLDLLDSKLDEIARDLERQDADRLLANRRFLESRFGARGAA